MVGFESNITFVNGRTFARIRPGCPTSNLSGCGFPIKEAPYPPEAEWVAGGIRGQCRRTIGIQAQATDTASAQNRPLCAPGPAPRHSAKAGEHFSHRERNAPAKDGSEGISLLLPDRRVQRVQSALPVMPYGLRSLGPAAGDDELRGIQAH